jgi:hypothetical protein
VTTRLRAVLALLGGAVAGALVFFAEIAALLALQPAKLDQMSDYVGMSDTLLIAIIGVFGFVFFAGGLVVVGVPAWWVLHRLGRRDWYYAVCLGALLGCVGFVIVAMWNPEWPALNLISFLTEKFGGLTARAGQLTDEGWAALARGAGGVALAGGVAGLALWRIAYRKSRFLASGA